MPCSAQVHCHGFSLLLGVLLTASSVIVLFHPIIAIKPLKIPFQLLQWGLVSNTDSGGQLNDESSAGTSSTCYRHVRDFVDVWRAALSFHRSTARHK